MKRIILTHEQEAKRTEGRVGRAFQMSPDEIQEQKRLSIFPRGGTKQFRNRVAKTRAANRIAKQSRKVNR